MLRAVETPRLPASVTSPIPAFRAYQNERTAAQTSARNPVEVFELHRTVDFRFRWQAVPPVTQPTTYLVFIVTEGEGLHTFGGETLYVRQHMLCFLGPEALHNWHTAVTNHYGYFCAFSEEFFNAERLDKTLLRSLPFFREPSGMHALHLQPEQTRYFLDLLQHMEDDVLIDLPGRTSLLRTQLSLLLQRAHTLYREGPLSPEPTHSPAQRLTNAFLALLNEDLAALTTDRPFRQYSVREYAERLQVSQNYLNETVRRQTGRTVGNIVHDALAQAATDLLTSSALSVREIAQRLDFASATYFARFYRQRTGRNPTQVRRARPAN
jgi:AraC-like DNA-binding protein/mannose-6-phosphate isomerase-like protein (cupin superfamily)